MNCAIVILLLLLLWWLQRRHRDTETYRNLLCGTNHLNLIANPYYSSDRILMDQPYPSRRSLTPFEEGSS
jgi:hypothetical protein